MEASKLESVYDLYTEVNIPVLRGVRPKHGRPGLAQKIFRNVQQII